MGDGQQKEFGRLRMDSGQHRRVMLTAVFLGILAFVPMVARLYSLMVTQYEYYSDLALRNQTRSTAVTADRHKVRPHLSLQLMQPAADLFHTGRPHHVTHRQNLKFHFSAPPGRIFVSL